MNMIGQNTPYGSLDYTQSGTTKVRDPDGNIVEIPNYTANVKLTPQQQAIFDQSQKAQSNLATIANEQSLKVRETLGDPFKFENQDAANWAYDLGAQRLDPRFKQQEDALRTQLINQGIRPGTEAYDREMARMGETKNDAYNQLMLTGRGQAFSEALATRNQPLNEMSALLSGSQVANPTSGFAQTPQTQMAGVDYAGIVNNNYAQQMAGWQAQQQANANMMGGLFGLGGTLGYAKMAYSDRRLKTDIQRVGTLDNGLPVYSYRMGDGPVQIGLMADEVAAVMPDAVKRAPSGFDMVDYDKATEEE